MKTETGYMFIGGGFLIIGIFIFLFGFSPEKTPSTQFEKTIEDVQNSLSQKTAWVNIEKKNNNTYSLIINNPKKENIQSVQLQINYNANIIKISNLSLPESPILELAFSGKGFLIDEKNGTIQITTGFAGKSNNIPEKFEIALFDAEKKEEKTLSFFSFPNLKDENAQQIIIFQNNNLVNILDEKKLKNFAL